MLTRTRFSLAMIKLEERKKLSVYKQFTENNTLLIIKKQKIKLFNSYFNSVITEKGICLIKLLSRIGSRFEIGKNMARVQTDLFSV